MSEKRSNRTKPNHVRFNHETEEQMNEQKSLNKFNSVTQKDTPENQNQQHNVREEGIRPINPRM